MCYNGFVRGAIMKEIINKIIGRNLKFLRDYRGFSQNDIAEMLDVTPTTISYYEKGTRTIPVDSLVTLCRVFNVSLDKFVGHSIFQEQKAETVLFANYKQVGDTFVEEGTRRLFNPFGVYFTVEESNGDTLLFLTSNSLTDGTMLVSESPFTGNIAEMDMNELPPSKLFLTTITEIVNKKTKKVTYSYTDRKGDTFALTNKSFFIYYGVLIARIHHIARTDELFS